MFGIFGNIGAQGASMFDYYLSLNDQFHVAVV
jgi:hypothetical protein